MRYTPDYITDLCKNEIFVFGSNAQGMHYGGAARTALKWGAVMGQGTGLQGKTYAIPTMFSSVSEIRPYVDEFIDFAKSHPEYHFLVTKIGCGIAGFPESEIAPLFIRIIKENIENVSLPVEFAGIINEISCR